MFNSKLNRPRLSVDLLNRPHLIEKLENHSHLPLILISAPAGYGKSILVSQWLEQRGSNYAWISLDQSMSDSSTFISYFFKTLERSTSVEMPDLKILNQEVYLLSWESIIEIIVNKINELKDPIQLILDDYHLINNREIDRLINTIISENLSNFRLILITRWDPPLQLRELRLYQRMLELRIRDLRFNKDEISELLAKEANVHFSEDEIKELSAKTEGWILAVRMIMMARVLYESGDKSLDQKIITSDLDVLVDQISANLDPDFIKRVQICSLCEQFNEELIDSIFTHVFKDSGDSGIFLAELKDLNFFLLPAADKASWFRFHHLLGDILRRRLERNEPGIIKPLNSLISSWFAGKGLIDEAIKYAIKSEDWQLACDLITEHRVSKLDKGEWWVVQRWLESIPWQIRKTNVDLLLTELLICEETWNPEDFSSILGTLNSSDIENSSDENISLYLFHLGYFLTYFKLDPKEAVASIERSKELCHDESYMFGGRRELILASSRQMLGLTALALKDLEDIQEKFEPSSIMHIRSIHGKVLVHLLSGNFESANNDSEKLLFLVQDSDLLYAKGWGSYFRGNVAFQSYNKDRVTQALKEALAFEGVFNYRVFFDALAGLILFKSLEGDESAANMLLKEMREKVGKLKDTKFQIYYQSISARVSLLRGHGDNLLEWAQTDWTKQSPASYFFLIDVPDLTKIRIIVSHGTDLQAAEAICVLAEVEAFLDSIHNKYHGIDIELLKAMALLRIDRKGLAKESLKKALLSAEKEDRIMPVMEAYRVMPSLFDLVVQDRNFRRLLSRIGLTSSNNGLAPVSYSKSDELSLREKEVIRLIATGLRNKEVADKLNISTVTVKSHLTHIFRKLEVPNRTSMLRLARDRRILK